MCSPDFPWLYHAHQGRYQDDLDFWRRCAAQTTTPLLELGCGTGRVTIPLVEDGRTVLALDNDRYMLRFLQRHLPPTLRSRVHLIQADMASFALGICLDLILMPCNTLSTLDDESFKDTLTCLARHLRPGGSFIASLPNPEVMRSLPVEGPLEVEEDFLHLRTGHPVQVMTAWRRGKDRLHVTWHYDHLFPDGRVERTTIELRHRLTGKSFYAQAFQQVGLELVNVYGDFDESPYREDSPYLILEARRSW